MRRKVNLKVSQAQFTSEKERIEDQGIFERKLEVVEKSADS